MGRERLGGTEYAKVILQELWGLPPALDMEYEKRVHNAIREIVSAELADAAHDLSDGGLAVALVEALSGRGNRRACRNSGRPAPPVRAVSRRALAHPGCHVAARKSYGNRAQEFGVKHRASVLR